MSIHSEKQSVKAWFLVLVMTTVVFGIASFLVHKLSEHATGPLEKFKFTRLFEWLTGFTVAFIIITVFLAITFVEQSRRK